MHCHRKKKKTEIKKTYFVTESTPTRPLVGNLSSAFSITIWVSWSGSLLTLWPVAESLHLQKQNHTAPLDLTLSDLALISFSILPHTCSFITHNFCVSIQGYEDNEPHYHTNHTDITPNEHSTRKKPEKEPSTSSENAASFISFIHSTDFKISFIFFWRQKKNSSWRKKTNTWMWILWLNRDSETFCA